MKYKMKSTGLSIQLHYRNSWKARIVVMDHYCQNVNDLYDCSIYIKTQNKEHSHDKPESNPSANEDEEELKSDPNTDKQLSKMQKSDV